jgi:hypothetical protein
MHKFKKTFLGRCLKRIFQRKKSTTGSQETLNSMVSYTPPTMRNKN